ncbi:hypothetical protein FKV75_04470 [Weissella paramesenteroides]|uniref:hypothetical protein n=1 Tax=Weissella paramesenteroides TaxID=1249 RepID=UPI001238EE02|nr:hypothetical protein [Weissella paramesenteroides]KAA8440046.1 hypothetical protein FKV81_06160 [Weissella paramesenteroides]KAA8441109.1 hypothetical protein FKV77_07100 [Weissella paramesenteroides]KAA8443115.1 hypothetical protein FKV75_04470 [Weissella paramesenteroides]KAA8445477.1 hypothetical protein FKV76_09100 [Weissella paramesenteroides]KAA8449023.1 hypothetical protein FKV74_08490 [Weissella paramesenteroides]
MIIGLYVLFAVVVGILGIYLLTHRHGFLGISAQHAKQPALWFGWLFTIDAISLLISTFLTKGAALPGGLFVILATLLTTVLAIVVVRLLFK